MKRINTQHFRFILAIAILIQFSVALKSQRAIAAGDEQFLNTFENPSSERSALNRQEDKILSNRASQPEAEAEKPAPAAPREDLAQSPAIQAADSQAANRPDTVVQDIEQIANAGVTPKKHRQAPEIDPKIEQDAKAEIEVNRLAGKQEELVVENEMTSANVEGDAALAQENQREARRLQTEIRVLQSQIQQAKSRDEKAQKTLALTHKRLELAQNQHIATRLQLKSAATQERKTGVKLEALKKNLEKMQKQVSDEQRKREATQAQIAKLQKANADLNRQLVLAQRKTQAAKKAHQALLTKKEKLLTTRSHLKQQAKKQATQKVADSNHRG